MYFSLYDDEINLPTYLLLSYISPLPLFSGSNVFPYIKYDDLLLWKTLWNVCCFLIHFRPKLLSYISPLPLFSGSKEAQAKIDQYIQQAIIVSYGLFVESEINLIFHTSREASFGKILEFCWGLKLGISYEIIIINWLPPLQQRTFLHPLLACESIWNAYPTEFFPIVSWSTHSSCKFWFPLFWN